MIRLRDTRYPSTAAFLNDAIRTASYYGFVPIEDVPRIADAKRTTPTIEEIEGAISFARRDERSLASVARKTASLMRPAYRGLFMWRIVQGTGSIPSTSLELHIIGHDSAVAEALLIAVASAIVEEAGLHTRTLSINNIGSNESSGRFVREASSFLRKHLETIAPSLRTRAAQDPIGTLVQLIERGHPALARMPQATEYLSEEERQRFWDFLEYLEMSGLPYELNAQVLGSRDVWTHTLYEIAVRDMETGASIPVASGGRYDALASRFAKRPEHAAMIAISCEMHGPARQKEELTPTTPQIFFAHLGIESRRRALPVLEQLRRAGIAVHHSITYDRLSDQMATAHSLGVPVILIMGHKEAMENAILVRKMATNSQESVPIPELTGYLRRHRYVPMADKALA